MKRIGGGRFASLPARADEKVVWTVLANRKQGRLARGGRLHLTTQRLVFTPHRFDAALGGRVHSVELHQIASVTKARRTFRGDFHAGGLRERLCLTLRNGDSQFFVVRHPDDVAEKIQQAVSK